MFAKVPWTEKPNCDTETTVRSNEIATFTFILLMHACIALLQKA